MEDERAPLTPEPRHEIECRLQSPFGPGGVEEFRRIAGEILEPLKGPEIDPVPRDEQGLVREPVNLLVLGPVKPREDVDRIEGVEDAHHEPALALQRQVVAPEHLDLAQRG